MPGDTVPFDGEQVATAAEIRGGPERAAPLRGINRDLVEEVMRFENTHVDLPQRPRQSMQQSMQFFLQHAAQIAAQAAHQRLTRGRIDGGGQELRFRQIPLTSQPRLIVRPIAATTANSTDPIEHQSQNMSNEVRPTSRRYSRGDDLSAITNIFDASAGQVSRQSSIAVPAINVRPQETAHIRQNQSTIRSRILRSIQTGRQVAVVEDREPSLRQVPHAAAIQAARTRVVIDLTGPNNVIDLTEDE